MTQPRPSFDAVAFAASLGDIPCETDPTLVRQKSRDFYWYSPVLKKQLDDAIADIVVMPRHEDDVVAVLRRCVEARVPLTPRGGGTGNYGQAMPLAGGVVLDLTALNSIQSITNGVLRVGAGAKLSDIEVRCRPLGWELRMFPSTRRTATVGGFVAGGMGGIGSINFGQLCDPGTLVAARVVTMEAEPKVLELRGAEVNRVQHAYGTNGIITELSIAMAPTQTWVDYVVSFTDFMALARFCDAVARADSIAKRMVSAVDGEAAAHFRPLEEELEPGDSVGLFLIAEQSVAPFEDMLREHGGIVSRCERAANIEARGLVPAFEFTWNHCTLQALKVDKGITYLQARLPAHGYLDTVAELIASFGKEVPMHLEFVRAAGEVACVGMPLVRYSTEPRLRAIIAAFEARGATVDPHSYMLEDDGTKATDPGQLAFKRRVDPYGLLNPGKMRGAEAPAPAA
jgi:FAD/FMN-containing dehydrogenase